MVSFSSSVFNNIFYLIEDQDILECDNCLNREMAEKKRLEKLLEKEKDKPDFKFNDNVFSIILLIGQ